MSIRNIFACLVHESPECVIDLVRNLRALDPSSLILLYNGGADPNLLGSHFPFERYGAVVHPSPRRAAWGRLHEVALDCMAWAGENHPFDTLTIVDSDQLAARPGYSEHLAKHLRSLDGVGLFGNSPGVQRPGTRVAPAETALREIDLWRPLLREFPDGEDKFVHWTFWPSTVFTADAARDLVQLFAANGRLQDIMGRTHIWATEEIILPTLAALMGYKVCANPCSYDYVRYRVPYSLPQLDAALARNDVFFIHPVPRQYDNALRKRIRDRWKHYESTQSPREAKMNGDSEAPRLLLTVPILRRMKGIEGWLDDAEADLLIAAVARAVAIDPESRTIVEIGSYCGRATVVLGGAVEALGLPAEFKVYAIDPHDGVVGALDQGIKRTSPTLEKFRRNIADAALSGRVETITKRSFEIAWDRPICFLLIDGLHDYANVARDFHQFERWISLGGYVAFHDYADYYPGVKTFVNELLALGHYEKVHHAATMIVLRKTAAADVLSPDEPKQAPAQADPLPAPAVVSARPRVSCIMPTADRREFVPQAINYFLRQDYAERELIVIDDGADVLADIIPSDPRIRYVRLDQRRTMGAKHNLACELAQGEVIAHWDDDDWMADWRLSYQIDALLAQPDDTICGLSRLFFYDPRATRAWEYIYRDAQRPWVIGSTFCYRREFSHRHKFPDMNEGADTVFVWGLRGVNVVAHSKHDFHVGLVHAGNTSPKRTAGAGWNVLPAERIHSLIKNDLPFYRNWSLQRAEA